MFSARTSEGMRMRLSGRSAIVTGAGQGLGYAYAEALAGAGARVWVNDLDEASTDAAVTSLAASGGHVEPLPGDVTVNRFFDDAIATVVAAHGSMDIVVNNAGISQPNMIWNLTDEQWDRVIAVNLTAVFRSVRAAARVMREQKYGRIINATSAAGLQGSIGQINYSATKAGVIGITKSAAKELARSGVTSNAIAPVAATPMTENIRKNEKLNEIVLNSIPMQRHAEPREIAPAVVFLASDDASYVTGEVLRVDGGLSI